MSIARLRNYWAKLDKQHQEQISLEAYIIVIHRYRSRVSPQTRLGPKVIEGKLVSHQYNRPAFDRRKNEYE